MTRLYPHLILMLRVSILVVKLQHRQQDSSGLPEPTPASPPTGVSCHPLYTPYSSLRIEDHDLGLSVALPPVFLFINPLKKFCSCSLSISFAMFAPVLSASSAGSGEEWALRS